MPIAMTKISTGIRDLDTLIDSVNIGDNVVWEIEAGTSEDTFIHSFLKKSLSEGRDVIYVSFNRSPHSILLNMHLAEHLEKLTILDCFTSGKGKSDRTFLKFYETPHPAAPAILKVNRPGDISFFSETVNSIQDKLSEGARYVFDSLTGMQDLWGDENSTYKFFTYMCPRLYDLGTVAYWILEKEAHSQAFKANLRHITQVVVELYKKKDKLFLKALKLDGRSNREAFKPHAYDIEDGRIIVLPARREPALDIGSRIKDTRIKMGMSQKELSEKVNLTSSFISQLENNQISPSLNSFLQIAGALGINPANLLRDEKKKDDVSWLIRRDAVRHNLYEKDDGYAIYNVLADEKVSAFVTVIEPRASLGRHFLQHKRKELIYVMKGTIFATIENTEKELKAGDSVHIDDHLPARWNNKGKEEVELLVLCF